MEYKFTETMAAEVAMSLSLDDIVRVRAVLQHCVDADVEVSNVSRWRMRDLVKALREAQVKAAESMRYEAEAMIKAESGNE